MRFLFGKKKTIRLDEYEKVLSRLNIQNPTTKNVDQFYQYIMAIFEGCGDFTYRLITLPSKKKIYLYYFQGLVNENLLQNDIIKPLSKIRANEPIFNLSEHVYVAQTKQVCNWKEVILCLLNGSVICHSDGELPIKFSVTSQNKRSITDPTTEYQVYGPKLGFIEDIDSNLALLRRYIKDPRLKVKNFEVGQVTHTKVSIVYLEGYADKQDIQKIRQK